VFRIQIPLSVHALIEKILGGRSAIGKNLLGGTRRDPGITLACKGPVTPDT
jgi:hypothetical protein